MGPEDDIMELKERGNALFREGDFEGAADAFQRAVEAVQQVRSKRYVSKPYLIASDLRAQHRPATLISGKDRYVCHD